MKPKPKWTKADERRARRMGWALSEIQVQGVVVVRITALVTPSVFSTDREAVEWVVSEFGVPLHSTLEQWRTCRKAIMLCCLGGLQ